jgi:hypothetical protein
VDPDAAQIYWRWPQKPYFQQFLQGDPTTTSVIKQLGLAQAFSIPYCQPKINAVKEFVSGFRPLKNHCDFRGRKFAVTTDVLREAFCLPSGKFKILQDGSCNEVQLPKFVEHVMLVLMFFQELVLGKPFPAENFYKSFWDLDNRDDVQILNRNHSLVAPDWAVLVNLHLRKEFRELKDHLQRSESKFRPGFRASNCGTE